MSPSTTAKPEEFIATGRRKTAVARVRIVRGTGKITINGKPASGYCPQDEFLRVAFAPAKLVEMDAMLDMRIRVEGGGIVGQAGAIAHGVARALAAMQPELRPDLKKNKMLTRDPRMRERKKSGQPGARKRFQFSKR
ncbi:MAG: 30S ribosomal protein S9 [Puniceicoccales bacterium]|jgi:small subunit ribosomal protein S9|nr:30S ribosomal protein S9 [Puniceicoccales bacterium]